MPTNRRRTLPNAPAKMDPALRSLLEGVKEIVETGEGVRGNPLDRKVTYRDLINSGIAKLAGSRAVDGSLRPGDAVSTPPPDMSTPPKPQGFLATGGQFGMNTLSWPIPASIYGNHAFTNIYRSEEDNFANAAIVGQESGAFYTDFVRQDAIDPEDPTTLKGYYYWITFVSQAGVEGPPNSPGGTYAQPLPDAAYLIETLSNSLQDEPTDLGAPDETLILNAKRFAVKVGSEGEAVFPLIIADVGGTPTVVLDTTIIREGSIQSGQLGAIQSGKLFLPDGSPVTTVGGLIRAEALDVDNISVASAATFYGDVASGNFDPNNAGWTLLQSGYAELQQGVIGDRVQIGGYDAEDVARFANLSNQRIENWVKPNTTLIDGNKIFTGDAYVDTLQIKNQAITIAASEFQGATVDLDEGWTTVAELEMDPRGQKLDILLSFSYEVNTQVQLEETFLRYSILGRIVAGGYSYDFESSYGYLVDERRYEPGTFRVRSTVTIPRRVTGWDGSRNVQMQLKGDTSSDSVNIQPGQLRTWQHYIKLSVSRR